MQHFKDGGNFTMNQWCQDDFNVIKSLPSNGFPVQIAFTVWQKPEWKCKIADDHYSKKEVNTSNIANSINV